MRGKYLLTLLLLCFCGCFQERQRPGSQCNTGYETLTGRVSWYGKPGDRYSRRFPAICLRANGRKVRVGEYVWQCAVAIQETLQFPLGSVLEFQRVADGSWQKVVITDVGYLGENVRFDLTHRAFSGIIGNPVRGIASVNIRRKRRL